MEVHQVHQPTTTEQEHLTEEARLERIPVCPDTGEPLSQDNQHIRPQRTLHPEEEDYRVEALYNFSCKHRPIKATCVLFCKESDP